MDEEQAIQVYKCLADRSRLRILSALKREPMYGELLAQRLDLTPATVSFHLRKMEDAGLVTKEREQFYTVYRLKEELLSSRIADTLPASGTEEEAREEAYRRKVIASFMKYGHLESIPVQRKKQRIILEELLRGFEKGRRYTEKEVNLILADANDDFCTLRRMMIGEGLMSRDHGIYWVSQK